MLRIMEHGLAKRHYNRIYTIKPDCTGQIAMFTSATLFDTMPAFFVLGWGCGATVAALLGELVWTKYGRRWKGKMNISQGM